MSILRKPTVALSNLINAHVALSNLRHVHVPCHYHFNSHVAQNIKFMSHVTKALNASCRPVDSRGLGPYRWGRSIGVFRASSLCV